MQIPSFREKLSTGFFIFPELVGVSWTEESISKGMRQGSGGKLPLSLKEKS